MLWNKEGKQSISRHKHAGSNIPVDIFSYYICSKLHPPARMPAISVESLTHQYIN